MTNKELKKIRDFHREVTMQQIIDPLRIKEIYHLVAGKSAPDVPYMKMQRTITVFVQNYNTEVLNALDELMTAMDEELDDDTTADPRSRDYIPPTISEDQEGFEPSHSEEDSGISPEGDTQEDSEKQYEPLTEDEEDYLHLKLAYDKAEDPNKKRSLKMKLNALEKKMRSE
jgi:hypothetical protein